MFSTFERELKKDDFELEPLFRGIVAGVEASAQECLSDAKLRFFKCGDCGALHCFLVTGRGNLGKEHFAFRIEAGQWHPKC